MNHLGKIVLYLKKEKAFSVVENFVLWLKERKRASAGANGQKGFNY